MDAQLKRGVLEICVLSVLTRGESYGYHMIKDLPSGIEVSESTLYPVLKRLEKNECVTVYTVEHNSRLRKYYRITGKGQKKIRAFLEEWKEMLEIYHFIENQVTGGTGG